MNKYSTLILVMLPNFIAGCVAAQGQTQQDLEKTKPTIYESEIELDTLAISSFANDIYFEHPVQGISGRTITVLLEAAERMSELSEKSNNVCGDDPLRSHIFYFYEEPDEQRIHISALERSIPDPQYQIGYYTNENGERDFRIPTQPGARFLDGCSIDFVYDVTSGTMEFIRFRRGQN